MRPISVGRQGVKADKPPYLTSIPVARMLELYMAGVPMMVLFSLPT
jgi:hypothetical protein